MATEGTKIHENEVATGTLKKSMKTRSFIAFASKASTWSNNTLSTSVTRTAPCPANFFADLFVENQLVVELKAVGTVVGEPVAQFLGCLRSSRIETGLLINFGSPILHVKKYLLTDLPA